MSWVHYLLLVNIYLVLFVGFYTLLLRRGAFFQLSRVCLIIIALFSFTINNSNAVNKPVVKTIASNNNHDGMYLDTVQKDNRIFISVQHQPDFPGGMPSLYNFLRKNVRYPATDRESNIQGSVYVTFVVEKDGSLTDIKAVRGPSETLKQEALRVMAASPRWKPGTQDNRPVRVAFTVPINFTLTGPHPDKQVVQAVAGDNRIFTAVDVEPNFPGGIGKFYEFIAANIRYPKTMHDKGIQGKVYLQFVVEADGSLSNIKAVRGPGYGAEEEAVRVIGLSPKWKPGIQNGKPVRVAYTVPVNFALTTSPAPVHGAVIDTASRKVVKTRINGIEHFFAQALDSATINRVLEQKRLYKSSHMIDYIPVDEVKFMIR